MNEVTIYHNKSCGTSRKGLSLIEDMGIKPKIRLYLNDPFTKEELKEVITELGIKPEELVRKKNKFIRTTTLKNNIRMMTGFKSCSTIQG